jgi:hypothetical protein
MGTTASAHPLRGRSTPSVSTRWCTDRRSGVVCLFRLCAGSSVPGRLRTIPSWAEAARMGACHKCTPEPTARKVGKITAWLAIRIRGVRAGPNSAKGKPGTDDVPAKRRTGNGSVTRAAEPSFRPSARNTGPPGCSPIHDAPAAPARQGVETGGGLVQRRDEGQR